MDGVLELVIKYWPRRSGLIACCVLVVVSYFSVVKFFFDDVKIAETYIFHAPFCIALVIIVGVAWVLTTRRKHVSFGENVFKIGLSFLLDEGENEDKVWNVIKPVLEDIDRNEELKFLKVIPLEKNRFRNKGEISRFLQKNVFGIDNILWLEIDSGKVDNNDKIVVRQGTFVRPNLYDGVIFQGARIDVKKEVQLRSLDKDWSYLEKESFLEKRRLKENIQDMVLYYAGINLLCLGKFEESLKTLKALYGQKGVIQAVLPSTNTINFQALLANRLAALLARLYSQVSYNYYNSGRFDVCFKFLNEAESIIKDDHANYWNFVQLARLHYESGNISKAKAYTERMQLSQGYTNEVALNRGFFAIVDDEPDELVKNYKRLKTVNQATNGIDILAFLNREMLRIPDRDVLFKYALAVIKMYYVAYGEGRKEVAKVASESRVNPRYQKLSSHCRMLIAKR